MKYFVVTFGCQMNESDSQKIASVLEKKNYSPAPEMSSADLIVINMCSVRQSAVNRVYGILKNIKEANPKVKTILTGCILKKDRRKFEKLFDEIIKIEDLTDVPVHRYEKGKPAMIPIMTGCNNFCSYCVVPYTRGREKSRPHEEIICEIKKLVENGVKEIWLLGQNVNSYANIPFSELLRKIDDLKGDFIIKFTSSHPKDFSDDLISAIKESKKVAHYLNLPVQSGDNEILKKMNRPYTVKQYLDLVKKIRKEIPDILLSTDVIVGFPGETEEQFQNTVKLFKKVQYDMAYINKYSPRSETMAEKLEDNVSQQEKKRREKILNDLIIKKGTYVKIK